MRKLPEGVAILASYRDEVAREVLTFEALTFVRDLVREFRGRREDLIIWRHEREKIIRDGFLPDFLPETESVRRGDWQVASTPKDLLDRRVEITGPTDAKMMINALNSGAKVFMADFEDSLSPTWANVTEGQLNLKQAVRRTLSFENPEGKAYRLNPEMATLVVRTRGWHLREKHVTVDGHAVSASLFDFALYLFHNADELLRRGSGPYFYLPKMESHLEARLWNDVFIFGQKYLGIPVGTIRATMLIETILAAFEMDEILYELREHAAALNAGRWDYIFSVIKKFRHTDAFTLPDRAAVTMTVPFMRAYTELLVKTCHKRGAHAIGGMSAFIPNRRDAAVTELALKKVTEDKEREAQDGFDGTWVAHPDLVPIAQAQFDKVLGTSPHQKFRLREDVSVAAADLLDFKIAGGTVDQHSIATNISVALQYLKSWLAGTGAVAIYNLMEDVATAEISRAQLWQWLHQGVVLPEGSVASPELYQRLKNEEIAKLAGSNAAEFKSAADILDGLVLSKDFTEFLTLRTYELLDH